MKQPYCFHIIRQYFIFSAKVHKQKHISSLSIFSSTCWPLLYLWEKYIKSFAHFLIGLFVYYYWFVGVFYIFWILTPYVICKYFLPLYEFSFSSVNCGLGCTEVLNFDIIQFIYFYFLCWQWKIFFRHIGSFKKYVLKHIDTFNEEKLENICHSLWTQYNLPKSTCSKILVYKIIRS